MSQSVNPSEWWSGLNLPLGDDLIADETLIVEPGDILIVRFDPRTPPVTEHERDVIRRACMGQLPGLGGVLVIEAPELAVYRP